MTLRLMSCILGLCLFCACKPSTSNSDTRDSIDGGTDTSLTGVGSAGLVVFHRYSSYDAWDSVLLMVDLSDHSVTEISQNWEIDHAMNAHFSPDGSQLVFMGDQRGGDRDWDVFLWTVGSSAQPLNLTEGWGTRDEDPKFTPDGTIVCKSNYDLIELDADGTLVGTLTSDGTDIEQSMPFPTNDGAQIIYAQGAGYSSDLHLIGRDGTGDTVVQGEGGIQEYYPIVRDTQTYLFTRWVSDSNIHDQIYMGFWDGRPARVLPLSDESSNDSDAFPYGEDAVFLSSTRSGGAGGYDIYVAGIDSEEVVSLSEWNAEINTPLDELGAVFYR